MHPLLTSRRFTSLFVFSMALVLAACTQVPLRSLWQLRQLDWQQLDPAFLLALAYLPEGIEARPDAAVITLKLERGNAAAEVWEERLVLRPVQGTAPVPWPEAPERRGQWLALGLDAQQQARFHALRSTLQAWKAQDGAAAKRTVSMSLEPQMCRRGATPAKGQKALRVSGWLRWKAQQAPVLLLDEAGLAELSERQPDAAALPLCADGAH